MQVSQECMTDHFQKGSIVGMTIIQSCIMKDSNVLTISLMHRHPHTNMQNYIPWDQPQVETKDLSFASTVVFRREPM